MRTNSIFIHKEAGEYLGLPVTASGKHYCSPLTPIKAIEMTEIIARVEARLSNIIDNQNKIILAQKEQIDILQKEIQQKTIGDFNNDTRRNT